MGKKHFTHGRLKVFMTIILAVILIVLVVVRQENKTCSKRKKYYWHMEKQQFRKCNYSSRQ